jgi:hypothetical protein
MMNRRPHRLVKSRSNDNCYYTVIIIMNFFFTLSLLESGYLDPERRVVGWIHSC